MTSSSDSDGPRDTAAPGDWHPDELLDRYEVATLALGADPDGEDPIVATLVRHPDAAAGAVNGAVLYVHGFTDYFFHEPLAEHFASRGYAFYAIDLRKCGRSLQPQHTPHFTTDLRVYDNELNQAIDRIGADLGPDTPILVGAHSTGGLITPLWLDRLRAGDPARHSRISGLFLNSPWFDLQGQAALRSYPVTLALRGIAAIRPKMVIQNDFSDAYGQSLHNSAHGEWSYDLTKKPLAGFPVTAGFVHAVRTGQRRLHRGLDIGVPSLVLRSSTTRFSRRYTAAVDTADAVLDVAQIAQWSGCLGDRVTVVPIPDARHDVFLSVAHAREHVYREVDSWLSGVIGADLSPAPDAGLATPAAPVSGVTQ